MTNLLGKLQNCKLQILSVCFWHHNFLLFYRRLPFLHLGQQLNCQGVFWIPVPTWWCATRATCSRTRSPPSTRLSTGSSHTGGLFNLIIESLETSNFCILFLYMHNCSYLLIFLITFQNQTKNLGKCNNLVIAVFRSQNPSQ